MLQKPEGFRAKGAAVVRYCKPLATPEMKSSGFYNVEVYLAAG
jgi:hypothetical protein